MQKEKNTKFGKTETCPWVAFYYKFQYFFQGLFRSRNKDGGWAKPCLEHLHIALLKTKKMLIVLIKGWRGWQTSALLIPLGFLTCLHMCVILGIKLGALCMVGKCFITKLYRQPTHYPWSQRILSFWATCKSALWMTFRHTALGLEM